MTTRRARRAAAARARQQSKRARVMACHDRFYRDYIRHLPPVPIDAPLEPGRVYHTCFHHDDWCKFYDTENPADCNCDPWLSRYVEPRRS